MARLEALSGKRCPECAGWPTEIVLRIVEEIIELGDPIPPPDPPEKHPAHFGPCACCGRTHRAKVVAIELLQGVRPNNDVAKAC
jgi:hypothetical protein